MSEMRDECQAYIVEPAPQFKSCKSQEELALLTTESSTEKTINLCPVQLTPGNLHVSQDSTIRDSET